MRTDSKGLRAVLREINQTSERSPLFWWMVENHSELMEGSRGKRLKWVPLSAVFKKIGLTDINGNPPRPNTARQTWLRARSFVRERDKRSSGTKKESTRNKTTR